MTRQGSRNRQEHGMSSNSRVDRRGFLRNAGRTVARRVRGRRPRSVGVVGRGGGEVSGARHQLDHLPGAGRIDRYHRARSSSRISSRQRHQDQPRICPGRGRARRAHQTLHRAAGRLRDDDGVGAGRRDRRGDRARGLQGQRVHPHLRLERGELAALRKEGFPDPDLPAIRRRVQKAPRRRRHHRPLRDRVISSWPRCRRN